MKNKPNPKTTQHQNPTKTHPETTLHVCIIYMPRTGHLLAVHPYPLKRWSQDIPGPTWDMQALDATWKLSGKYFLLKYSIPFSPPQATLKPVWRSESAVQHLVLNWRFPSYVDLEHLLVKHVCSADSFLYLCCASTFQTSTANVLLRTIQWCCLGHLDDLIGLFFFLAICIKSMIHINYAKGS